MCTRVSWVSGRSSQRKKAGLNVDLNVPAVESHDEGTSICPPRPAVVPDARRDQPELLPIDVDQIEDDDDDVLISSPRAFTEAKAKSGRNRRRRVVDVDDDDSLSHSNNHNKRRRLTGNQQVINCESYVNLECECSSLHPPPPPPPPPPPKELTFNCPVCMGPMVEEMTTKCGHIFCKACIKTAIAVQKKCPTCRKKTTAKDIMRVYLPSAS